MVPYNHACPKRGLLHQDRESSVIRPLLYLQATMAGYSLICLFCSFQDLDGHLFTIYASLTNTTKMSSPRIWLMAVLTVIFLSGVFAPYPPGHPNAFLNPLIIPWWIYTPCSMRKAIHMIATGTPLPPDGCIKYRFRSHRPQRHR